MSQSPAPPPAIERPPRQPRVALGVIAGVGAAVLGVWVYCWILFSSGMVGAGALATGAVVGLPMALVGRCARPFYGIIAAVLAILASIGGDLLATLKANPNFTLAELFGTQLHATLNTTFNGGKLVCYLVAGLVGYFAAVWKR